MAAGSLDNMFCSRCDEGFEPHEKIVNSNGELWHTQCFVYVIEWHFVYSVKSKQILPTDRIDVIFSTDARSAFAHFRMAFSTNSKDASIANVIFTFYSRRAVINAVNLLLVV